MKLTTLTYCTFVYVSKLGLNDSSFEHRNCDVASRDGYAVFLCALRTEREKLENGQNWFL